MSYPQSQFPDLLNIAERDGEGGIKAELPSLIRGEALTFTAPFPTDAEYGDWTEGAFDLVLRAAPGASGDPLAEYVCTTGTPSGGVTTVTFALAAGTGSGEAQENIPEPVTANQLVEVFAAVGFTPTGSSRKTLVTTRQLVRGRI